ncbi:hypothetical protein AALA61_05820 [Oscillospiraceae bacterium 42-9]
MDRTRLAALRMERQHLGNPASEEEYLSLYRDLQPGVNVYWNGFGQPPTLSFRADFDDLAFNRARQLERGLVKGRFAGGNLGWIVPEDMALYAALYRKPLASPNERQFQLLELIERSGPLSIQQMKEETGMLVKAITPVLHRLQEAFLIYEDQYDGEWDRGWCPFEEMFPGLDLERLSRLEALKTVLPRFAYRFVWFSQGMAKAFYRLPDKDLKAALAQLEAEGTLVPWEDGWVLPQDRGALEAPGGQPPRSVYAIHRNDPLFKAAEPELKKWAEALTAGRPYDCQALQFLLVDGEFRGVVAGHFRNGPYDLNDVVLDLPDPESRREEILEAVRLVNFGQGPQRFMGEEQ